MSLVERDTELAVLGDLLHTCRQGKGQVVVISGAVASGKTALVQAFAEQVTESGAVYLGAVASRAERMLPMGVLEQMFRCSALPAAITERAAQLLDDRTINAILHDPGERTMAHVAARVFEELRSLLFDMAKHDPLVIVIDDVQFTDAPSMQFLASFARRIKSSRILIILSECTPLLSSGPLLRSEIGRQPNCHRIQLTPLSRCAVAALLARSLPLRVARRLAVACHAVSGANLLLVEALAEDYNASARGAPAQLIFGTAFNQAVMNILYRCEPTVISVAQAIAVLGDAASPALLGELLNFSAESAARSVSILDTAGLLEAGRFRHNAMRAAVLDSMAADDRAVMNRGAARVLHNHGAVATILAGHLLAADRIEVPGAVPLLQEAADQALADGHVDRAVSYLMRAHDECADARRRATITSTLTRAKWRVDPASAARHLPELIAAAREGNLGGQDAVILVYYLLWHGHVRDATEVLFLESSANDVAALPLSALDIAAPGGQAPDFDVARLWLNCVYPVVEEHTLRDRTARTAATATLVRTPPKGARMMAYALACGCEKNAVIAAEQILEGYRLDDSMLPSVTAALVALICADRLDRAAFWCNLLLEDAAARDIPTWGAVLKATCAMIEVRRGSLPAAEGNAYSALSLLTPKGWGVFIGAPLAVMLRATAAAGKYEDAEAYLGIPVPEAMFQTPCGLLYLRERGRLYLSTNRLHAALADFQYCGELMIAWGLDLPTFVPWRTDAAQVYVRMGMSADARELVNEQLARLGPGHSGTRGITLRVLASASEPRNQRGLRREQLALLREAVELLHECGDRLELAYALAALSRAYQDLGEHSEARISAGRARHLAEQCGAEPLKRALPTHTDSMAPDSSSGPNGLVNLSDAERRVAALAAHGDTNRQIAGKLHVTVSTVEQHLTRVYRKLDIGCRDDLPTEFQPCIVQAASGE